ncbi:hypothetical protein MKX03_007154 [Papaver bracteatum]|nr:hypothetical protein MKX03_007154 [Papaver bracteatum]
MDLVAPNTEDYKQKQLMYPDQFLNKLEYPHMPSHKLQLKVGLPIILLQDLDREVLKGTRLIITCLKENQIFATVITGPEFGKKNNYNEKTI